MLLALIDKLFSGIVSMLPSSIVERYPQDKIKHVIAGVIVGVASGAFAYHLGMTMLWAVYSTAIIGAAKEAYDAIANAIAASKNQPKPHGVDLLDFVATVFGGIIAWGLLKGLLLVV